MASESGNTFRILVASDTHLGFMESDSERKRDSFVTFEEILSIARDKNVDLILHGGNLFHEKIPSQQTLHACLSLLREYCMGDKAVQFEYLSNQSEDFQYCKFQSVNYKHFKISIPMFSIHGNHDDPIGQDNLSSLDLLHTAGLMNYFGKAVSLDKIQISPVLLQKGETRLSLYGLGFIRDERLHDAFLSHNVTMLPPPEENQDEWFSIFVLHQDRNRQFASSCSLEQFLEDFLDLVIWGHEYRPKVTDTCVEKRICQPGSSIVTSFSEGEMVPKCVDLLEITKKEFVITPIPLKTVRQFFYVDDIVLSTHINPDTKADEAMRRIEAFCKEKVQELLERARKEHSGSKSQPLKPLIRLERVDYTGFIPFSPQKLLSSAIRILAARTFLIQGVFVIQYGPIKSPGAVRRAFRGARQEELFNIDRSNPLYVQPIDAARIEELVRTYLTNEKGEEQLKVLSAEDMGRAVKDYVKKMKKSAILEIFENQVEETQKSLKTQKIDESDIEKAIHQIKEERCQKTAEEDKKQVPEQAHSLQESEFNVNDFSGDNDAPSSTKGRGRGRGARSRGSRQGKGRGKNITPKEDVDFDYKDKLSRQISTKNLMKEEERQNAAEMQPRLISQSSKRTIESNILDSDDDDDVENLDQPRRKNIKRE